MGGGGASAGLAVREPSKTPGRKGRVSGEGMVTVGVWADRIFLSLVFCFLLSKVYVTVSEWW